MPKSKKSVGKSGGGKGRRNGNGALHNKHREFLCDGIAIYKPHSQIVDEFLEEFPGEFQPDIERRGVPGFRKWLCDRIRYYDHLPEDSAWTKRIQEKRQIWRDRVEEDLPIANTRKRVQNLEKQYDDLVVKAEATENDYYAMILYKEARETLDAIAQELGQKVIRQDRKVDKTERGTKTVIIETKMPNYAEMANAPEEPSDTTGGGSECES